MYALDPGDEARVDHNPQERFGSESATRARRIGARHAHRQAAVVHASLRMPSQRKDKESDMASNETQEARQARHEAECTAIRVLPNERELRALLRRLAPREPGLPVLAGERFGIKAIFRIVRSVGVELMLEHRKEFEERIRRERADSILSLMDRIGMTTSARSSRPSDTPFAIGSGSDEVFGSSQAPRTGSAVILLHEHDTMESYLHCGDGFQKFIFRVVHLHADNSTDVVEENYLSYAAAVEAFPEAAIRTAGDSGGAGSR